MRVPLSTSGDLGVIASIFGFHDHIINPINGRPEPHPSWLAETFIKWFLWIGAAIVFITAIFSYSKRADLIICIVIAGQGAVLAVGGLYRHFALNRKRMALRKAEDAYEAGLANTSLSLG